MYALTAAVRSLDNHPMSHLPTVSKRCERCERLFDIYNVPPEGRIRDIVLMYTPCKWCGYIKDIKNPRFDKTGRCLSCSVPFSMIDHKAKGMCHRCLMAHYRKHSTGK